ncbi:MAG: hypothetical protein KAI57_03770 [Candidatus Pacebacteria bacterium]|nr:hypothetical protein [Candidatus Paceibacterota bacterium]
MNEKINYIYNNPVKKEFVANQKDWKYSSAKNRIANNNSVIELDSLYE